MRDVEGAWFWSTTGDEIIYVAPPVRSGSLSIRAVHTASGAARTILETPPDGRFLDLHQVALSPDGRHVYFLAYQDSPPITGVRVGANLYRVPTHDQAVTELVVGGIDYPAFGAPLSFALSPDQNRMAFPSGIGDFGANANIVVFDRISGQRTILPKSLVQRPETWHWSPDSRQLLIMASRSMTLYDVDAGSHVDWEVQLPKADITEIVEGHAVQWNTLPTGRLTPAVYVIQKTFSSSQYARVWRNDFASRTSSDMGTLHHGGPEGWYGGYSWSTGFDRVAWSSVRCVEVGNILDSTICLTGRFEVGVTDLSAGVDSVVGGLTLDQWPGLIGSGQTILSPDGTEIAASWLKWLRVFKR